MANDSVMEQIVKSLSFEVEAIPQGNVVQVTTTSNATPMNVKIRVRKKAEAGLRQGILSLPQPNRSDSIPEKIRLVSSDQTIMSFNIVMEAEFEKPMKKPRKTILGAFMPTICLRAQPKEDNYEYMPSTTYRAKIDEESSSHSECALRSALILIKDEQNAEGTMSPKRNNYFGKCKPGGCLDPPFGEDRQPYTPAPIVIEDQTKAADQNVTKNVVHVPAKDRKSSIFSNKISKKNKRSKDEAMDDNVMKIGSKTESVLELYQSGSLQTSKTVSSSIMTYPSTLNSSDQRTQEEKQRGSRIYDKLSKNSIDVHSGSYFTMPKGTNNVLDKSSILFKTDEKFNIQDAKEGTVKTKSELPYKNDVPLTDMEDEDKKVLRTLSSTNEVIDKGPEGYLMQPLNKNEKDLLVAAPKQIFKKLDQIQAPKKISETELMKEQNIDTEISTTIPPEILLLPGIAAISSIDKSIDSDTDETKKNYGVETIWSPTQTIKSDMTGNLGSKNIQHIELKTSHKGTQEMQDVNISQTLTQVENLGSSKTGTPNYERVDLTPKAETKGTSEHTDWIKHNSPELEDVVSLKPDIPEVTHWSKDRRYDIINVLSGSVSDDILEDQNAEKNIEFNNQPNDLTKVSDTQLEIIAPLFVDKIATNESIVLSQNVDKSEITLNSKHEKSDYDIKALDIESQPTDVLNTAVGKVSHNDFPDIVTSIKRVTTDINKGGDLYHLWKNDMLPLDSSTKIFPQSPMEKKTYSNENIDTLKENHNEKFNGLPNVKEGIVHKKVELVSSPIVPLTNKDKESLLSITHLANNQSEIDGDSIQDQVAQLVSPIENTVKTEIVSIKENLQTESINDFQAESQGFQVSPKNEDNLETETLLNKTGYNDETETKYDDYLQSSVSVNTTKDKYNETETISLSSQGNESRSEESKDDDSKTQLKMPSAHIIDNNQTGKTRPVSLEGDKVEIKFEEDNLQAQQIFPTQENTNQTEAILSISSQGNTVEAESRDLDCQSVPKIDDFQAQSTFQVSPENDNDQTETTLSMPLSDSVKSESRVDDFLSESKEGDFQTQSLFPVNSKEYFDQAVAVLPDSSIDDKIEAQSREDGFQSELKDNNLQMRFTLPVRPEEDNEQPEPCFPASPINVETKLTEDYFNYESQDNNFPMQNSGDIQITFDQDNRNTLDSISSDILVEQPHSLLDTKFETTNVTFHTTQPVINSINTKDDEIISKYNDNNKDVFDIESEVTGMQNYDKIKIHPYESPSSQGSFVKAEMADHLMTDQQKVEAKHITFGDDIKVFEENDSTTIPSPRNIEACDDFNTEVNREVNFEKLNDLRNSPEILQSQSSITHAENIELISENKHFSNHLSSLLTPATKNAGTYQINVAIQSYFDEKNKIIIRSFNADEEPIRFPNDTIRIIHSTLDIENELKIPIDINNDFCIVIKQKDSSGANILHTAISDQLNEYQKESDPIKRNVIIADDIRKTLVAVYEEELLPLRGTIAELKVNIEILKAFVKKQRPARIVPIIKKCSCMRR